MQPVKRGIEPCFVEKLRWSEVDSPTEWKDLTPYDRNAIRRALGRDFGHLCFYCQQPCEPYDYRSEEKRHSSDRDSVKQSRRIRNSVVETIDHFRPRQRFRDRQFDWLNWVYCCARCNQKKANKWPRCDKEYDRKINGYLLKRYPRYLPVDTFVNPNASNDTIESRLVQFDCKSGEILPSEDLDNEQYSIVLRTILI